MAVLASQDWYPPRDYTMDAPSPNSISTSVPRQRSSPSNEQSPSTSPISQQQPYPYPVQQQQAGWNPAHQQQQQHFYQSFYQNPHQPGFPHHPHPQQGQIHPQNPYFDPTNAQFTQWAYQQMMFHQAHQMSHVPSPLPGQRSRAGSANQQDYYANYNIFPTGTPPPHPSQLPNGYPAGQGDLPQNQYGGFHPYRRPSRQNSHNQDVQQQQPPPDWRSPQQQQQQHSPPPSGPIQPPYARADAAGSSTSVNSHNSNTTRQRTNSTQGSVAGHSSGSQSGHSHPKSVLTNGHGRIGSANSNSSQSSSIPSAQRPHQRTTSSSSSGSGAPRPSLALSATTTSSTATSSTLRRPSPLSQGTFTAAEKRMSRDDSDLAAMMEPASAPGVRSGGLKGRLRRALSLNAGEVLREEDEDQHVSSSTAKGKASVRGTTGSSAGRGVSQPTIAGDDESTATVQKKKSRSLFNSRLNRSTDNISLSSTMSSASMVIRKLGSIGKLARRNSLAGITSLFKDKKEKEGGDEDAKKSKKKKGEKGTVAEASVSHVTAELDHTEWSQDMSGLTPAARLARQHTLKSNAEAAARAKADAEAKAAAAAAAQAQSLSDASNLPTTWDKNTTKRHGEPSGKSRVNEDGGRVVVEDDSDSDDGQDQNHAGNFSMDGWDDDEDWGEAQEEEDVTIRQGLEGVVLDDDEMEPWAMGLRRSVERTRKPKKGILKMRADGSGYEQDTFMHQRSNLSLSRHRSNSYDSPPSQGPELGPLAHIASPDPDQLDGLHKHHNSSSSQQQQSSAFLPPLSFETTTSPHSGSSKGSSEAGSPFSNNNTPTPEKTLFSHPNSSAPALSTKFSNANPPTLTHRSATAPAKRLAFASNLSVYDTFPSSVYDRRSEPATWSRLTPALAQRIKEELNSYKMEEMEVHASSRVHTQFFV